MRVAVWKVTATCIVCFALVIFRAGGATAGARQHIGPGEHFAGLVNGSNTHPTVKVVCAGPITARRVGSVAGGQTMSVTKTAKGPGYTGRFSEINAWFVPTSSSRRPTQLTFDDYGVAKKVPTSILVPCYGSGQVEFSSCPYLAPCAYGWVPAYVNVRFVDVAF